MPFEKYIATFHQGVETDRISVSVSVAVAVTETDQYGIYGSLDRT